MKFKPLSIKQLNQFKESIALLVEKKVEIFDMESKIQDLLNKYQEVRGSMGVDIICEYDELMALLQRLNDIPADERVKATFSQDVAVIPILLEINSNLDKATSITELVILDTDTINVNEQEVKKKDKTYLLNLFDNGELGIQ